MRQTITSSLLYTHHSHLFWPLVGLLDMVLRKTLDSFCSFTCEREGGDDCLLCSANLAKVSARFLPSSLNFLVASEGPYTRQHGVNDTSTFSSKTDLAFYFYTKNTRSFYITLEA